MRPEHGGRAAAAARARGFLGEQRRVAQARGDLGGRPAAEIEALRHHRPGDAGLAAQQGQHLGRGLPAGFTGADGWHGTVHRLMLVLRG
jgi:hypothetical protein